MRGVAFPSENQLLDPCLSRARAPDYRAAVRAAITEALSGTNEQRRRGEGVGERAFEAAVAALPAAQAAFVRHFADRLGKDFRVERFAARWGQVFDRAVARIDRASQREGCGLTYALELIDDAADNGLVVWGGRQRPRSPGYLVPLLDEASKHIRRAGKRSPGKPAPEPPRHSGWRGTWANPKPRSTRRQPPPEQPGPAPSGRSQATFRRKRKAKGRRAGGAARRQSNNQTEE